MTTESAKVSNTVAAQEISTTFEVSANVGGNVCLSRISARGMGPGTDQPPPSTLATSPRTEGTARTAREVRTAWRSSTGTGRRAPVSSLHTAAAEETVITL